MVAAIFRSDMDLTATFGAELEGLGVGSAIPSFVPAVTFTEAAKQRAVTHDLCVNDFISC
jgi:hypothetical protein